MLGGQELVVLMMVGVVVWSEKVGKEVGKAEDGASRLTQAAIGSEAFRVEDLRAGVKEGEEYVNYRRSLQTRGGISEMGSLWVLGAICLSAVTTIVLVLGALFYFIGCAVEMSGHDISGTGHLSRSEKRRIRDVQTAVPASHPEPPNPSSATVVSLA